MYCRRRESVKRESLGMIDIGDHSTDQVSVNLQSTKVFYYMDMVNED